MGGPPRCERCAGFSTQRALAKTLHEEGASFDYASLRSGRGENEDGIFD